MHRQLRSAPRQPINSCESPARNVPDLAELPPEDAKEYLNSYGLKESGLELGPPAGDPASHLQQEPQLAVVSPRPKSRFLPDPETPRAPRRPQ